MKSAIEKLKIWGVGEERKARAGEKEIWLWMLPGI